MRDTLRRWFSGSWWVSGYDGVYGPMRYGKAKRLALRTPTRAGYGWSPTAPTVVIGEPPKTVMEWSKEELDQWLLDNPLPESWQPHKP